MSTSFRWPIIMAIAGVVLFVLAIWTFIQGIAGWHTNFQGPGSVIVEIPAAGDYRLWHESKTTIEGRLQVVDDDLPSGSVIEVTSPQGATIPLNPIAGNMSQEMGNTRRVAIGRIEIPDPGRYTFSVTGFEQPRAFRLSEIRFFQQFLRSLSYGLPGGILIIIAMIWAIVVAARRRRMAS